MGSESVSSWGPSGHAALSKILSNLRPLTLDRRRARKFLGYTFSTSPPPKRSTLGQSGHRTHCDPSCSNARRRVRLVAFAPLSGDSGHRFGASSRQIRTTTHRPSLSFCFNLFYGREGKDNFFQQPSLFIQVLAHSNQRDFVLRDGSSIPRSRF